MNLYELFDNATDNLAELPDLAPAAERIVRRRRIATRSFSAACAAALIIGVGTLTLHPESPLPSDIGVGGPCSSSAAAPSISATPNPGYSLPTSPTAGGSTANGFAGVAAASTFPQQAAVTLSGLWPMSCATVVPAGGIYPATDVERYQAYEVVTSDGSFPLILRFDEGAGALAIRQDLSCPPSGPTSGNCTSGLLDDAYPYTSSVADGYGLLTFSYQDSIEVTLMEFDRSADAITLAQLEEMGNSAEMMQLVELAIADEVPADNGITASGLSAEASSVWSQSTN
jgi:hypothetical protein